ncbi:hypothetical protein EMIT048CA2_40089 [Pseudomonas chlororaphis]
MPKGAVTGALPPHRPTPQRPCQGTKLTHLPARNRFHRASPEPARSLACRHVFDAQPRWPP